VLSPAFRWQQTLDEIWIEVKWTTRFDSPACLDTYEHHSEVKTWKEAITEPSLDDDVMEPVEVQKKEQMLHVRAMCRNDNRILEYELKLDLLNEVQQDKVTFET